MGVASKTFKTLVGTGRHRLRDALYGTSARILALGTQLLVVIMMSRMLTKAEFGDAMIAFAVCRLLNLAFGSGFGGIVLYHVGRQAGDHLLDVRLMRTVSVWCFAFCVIIAASLAASAGTVAWLFNKPDLEAWIVTMSPMIVFGTLLQVTACSLDSRTQITRSIVVTELVPSLIRMTGFGILLIGGLSNAWISVVLWFSLALPWLIDTARLLDLRVKGFAALTAWDLRYGGWLAIFPLLGQQLQGIDMILVGFLFSSDLAAEYSIASRVATFYPFLMQILSRTVTPKIGALIHNQEFREFESEIHRLRIMALLGTAGLTTFIIGISPALAYLSGDYQASLPIMVALAVAPLIRTMYVGNDIVLRMRGHGSLLAGMATAAAVCLGVISWTFNVYLGIYVLPAAMAVSAIFVNALVSYGLSRAGVKIFDGKMLVPIGIASSILALIPIFLLPLSAAMSASFVLALLTVSAFCRFRSELRHSVEAR